MTAILCFRAIRVLFFQQMKLMNSTTSYFKSQMSYITSITAETFLIAALLSFIFAIAAFVSDIFIGLILMVSGLSSYISQEVLLCFFFFLSSVTFALFVCVMVL